MDEERARDGFRGALLGTFAGDALGAPFEGWDEPKITRTLENLAGLAPNAPERALAEGVFGLLTGAPMPPGTARYTDDTEMMIGVAESLAAHPGFDGADMARRFAENFHPRRGYGIGAHSLLLRLKRGEPWDEVGACLFGGRGSFGNGAAMRAAPVGVLFHDRPDGLRRVADAQAAITHAHPLGRRGAVIQAAAVAAAMRRGADPAGSTGRRFWRR